MLLSLIIPVYGEEEVIPQLLKTLDATMAELPCECEVLFVDDGSRDRSAELLAAAARQDPRIKVIGFSRNFGHQVALTAGMDFAQGDAIVIMDADLQDPPHILKDMIRLYEEGFDVVSAQRITRRGDSAYKRLTARLFYWIMRKAVDPRIIPEVGDFRLFSRNALIAIRGFREQHRFMRGLVAWLGLKEVTLPFERQERAAGRTHYSTVAMLRFAWTGITSFSGFPLRISLISGVVLTIAGFLYFLYSAYSAIFRQTTVQGWTSLVFLQVMFSGAILIAIGVIGDYIARIYEESKGRPLYIVNAAANVTLADHRVDRAVILSPRTESGPERSSRERKVS
jgi:dolichol-phosphate mannosyltransferase